MSKNNFFALLIICAHLLLLANLRFEAWPEMLVYPYLLNNNFKLYQDIINPYPPILSWFLSGYFRLFGLSVINLKILTLGWIVTIDSLIYYIAKKRFGKSSAIPALAFFVIFQPLLDGNGLWFDLALTPLLLFAFYRQSPWFLAVAFFVKQSTIWLFPLFLKKWKKVAIVLTGLFLVSCFLFLIKDDLNDYLFWVWRFPFTIFPSLPGHKDLGSIRLWTLALTPFILPTLLSFKRPVIKTLRTVLRAGNQNPLVWMALSFLFIFPRFGLFHLQPALAFATLSLAQLTPQLSMLLRSHAVKLLLTAYCLLLTALWYRQIKLFWHQPIRFLEPEVIAAAQQLTSKTSPDQPILFLNAPDQLMVLSHRLPIKPWATTFPWYFELPDLQKRIITALASHSNPLVLKGKYQNQDKFTPGSYIPQQVENYVNHTFPVIMSISPTLSIHSR